VGRFDDEGQHPIRSLDGARAHVENIGHATADIERTPVARAKSVCIRAGAGYINLSD
jgi:hypothetical protein